MKRVFTLLTLLVITLTSSAPAPTYLDPKAPVEARVKDLISRMTLEEKVAQLVFFAPAIDRLQVPAYNWWNEGLHGVARNGLATSFPQAIGLAAMWDRSTMNEVGTAISDEARAKYNIAQEKGQRGRYQGLTIWSPNINIFRDPRWGRGMETYGEDPYLTGKMAVEFIKGLQGSDPKYYKTIACSKHYAVHSGPEPERHTFDAEVSEYDLRETYLPAFKMTVEEAKVGSFMCAYNSLRGKACCGNDPLMQDILRKEWGFDGFVVSDCGAVIDIYANHKDQPDAASASAVAVKAGTDLECGNAYFQLADAVKKGLIKESEIDVSLTRLFTARFKMGMFDPAEMVPYSKLGLKDVDSKQHRDLALKAAQKSIVLLKNNKNTLPLKKDLKNIAVIGPNANNVHLLMANYSGFPSQAITPLEGIRSKVSPQTKVVYEPGCEVVENLPYLETITAKYLFTGDDMKQHGLKGEYFNNESCGGYPAVSQVDTVINITAWKNKTTNFSVRWTGYLVPPATGKYQLGCWGGTDFKFYLEDSVMVADNGDIDNDHSYRAVNLEKGKPYRIRIETAVNVPACPLEITWSIPDNERAQRALAAAKNADVVIFCAGLSPRLEGEEMNVNVPGFTGGDRISIDLPATQQKLIKDMAALGKPIVLVLLNGSAIAINWENANIPAIVESWYPGQASGTAIADVLFGDYNPAGRLPVTFYKSVDQLPKFSDYNMKGRTYRYFEGEVIYPFGYGLSYTTFTYNNVRVTGNKVMVDVKNTGTREGEEVVQLYVKGTGTKNNDVNKALKGFERISLKLGETKTVEFTVTPQMVTFYKEGTGYTYLKGEHTLLVGSSSADKSLKAVKVMMN